MGKVYIGVTAVGGHKLWGGGGWWKIDGRRWEGCGPGMPGPYGVVKSKVGDVDEVDGDIFNIGGELLWKALAICSLL